MDNKIKYKLHKLKLEGSFNLEFSNFSNLDLFFLSTQSAFVEDIRWYKSQVVYSCAVQEISYQ